MRAHVIIIAVLSLLFNTARARVVIVNSPQDLNGETIYLTGSDYLIFKSGGCLRNGVIVGDNTLVFAKRKQVFDNITLKGNFKANIAYSDWFGIKSDCILDDDKSFLKGSDYLQQFRNLLCFDNVSISPGIYMVSGTLSCKSGQTIKGNCSVLKFTGKGVVISIGGSHNPTEHVKIKGLQIIGSKLEHSDKTEWWHGINIAYSNDITIEDVSSVLCRGDGFYIGNAAINDGKIPQNISFRRVSAYNNHRQGLSITRVRGLKVIDSEFCYTCGMAPQAGIDIEPNHTQKENGSVFVNECEDIVIKNCVFKGNNGNGIELVNHLCKTPAENSITNVTVSGCHFFDDNIIITGCTNAVFEKSDLYNSSIHIQGRSLIKGLSLNKLNLVTNGETSETDGIRFYTDASECLRSNIRITNTIIKGFSDAAVKVDNAAIGRTLYKDFVISNCKITSCGEDIVTGIGIDGFVRKNNSTKRDNNYHKSGMSMISVIFIIGVNIFLLIKSKNKRHQKIYYV